MEITEKPKFTNWSGEAVSKREAISDRLDYIIDSFIQPYKVRVRSEEAKALKKEKITRVKAILNTANNDSELEKLVRDLNKEIDNPNPTAVIDAWIAKYMPNHG